jgi:hypothetical protein
LAPTELLDRERPIATDQEVDLRGVGPDRVELRPVGERLARNISGAINR